MPEQLTPHHERFNKVAAKTADPEHESPFQRLADWVSAAMGRPTNIIIWLILVLFWTVLFAAKIVPASGSFLPAWFTGQGFNFPLNLITTVAELFIGFLVAAAANRAQRVLEGVIDGIRTVLDHVATVADKTAQLETSLLDEIKKNTELTEQIHTLSERMSTLTQEVHEATCGRSA
jgi:low affinity Fe/Cu permease